MKALVLCLALLGAGMPISSVQAAPQDAAARHAQPSSLLKVSGAVKAEQAFDLAAIKAMTGHDSGALAVVCASGATVATVKNFRGVRLTDLIDRVGIAESGHKDSRRMVVIARATDGYVVTFSWNELFNTDIGKDVLVAYEKDGQPLGPEEGQFLLISGKDIKTGPRHVRWLSDIEIKREQ
jgi:DMSO/TMAO reductase YedYZ molybdopterin-dependent catalytic subunit